MPTITRFEYQHISYEELGQEVSKLERLNTKFNNKLLSFGRNSVKTQAYVGVIRSGDLTIQVLPKIDRNDDASGATRNLINMLAYANNLKIDPQQSSSLSSGKMEWLEFLTSLYATNLLRLLESGVPRSYISVDETLPLVRGRWNLQRQLTRRPHIQHLFDLTYDEFSEDTVLNRVFLYVTERLLRLTNHKDNRRSLRQIKSILGNVSGVPSISFADLERVQFNRLNLQYQPAFNLARLFIQQYTPQLMVGKQDV